MPLRQRKRPRGPPDPTKSDSDDETYGTSASKTTKSRRSKDQPRRPSRKKQRRRYSGEDSEDDDEISESEGSLIASQDDIEEEEEEVEIGPNGRPKRKVATKNVTYDESGSDEIEDPDSDAQAEEEALGRIGDKPSLVVKLRGTPGTFPQPSSRKSSTTSYPRSSRARSGSLGTSRPTSSHKAPSTRSKGRAPRDQPEIQSPNNMTGRRTKGGKGPKKSTKPVQEEDEGEEEESKPQQSTDELQKDFYVTEIAASREELGGECEESDGQPVIAAETDPRGSDIILSQDIDVQVTVIPESGEDDAHEEEEYDDDDEPINRRTTRQRPALGPDEAPTRTSGRSIRSTQRSTLGKRKQRSSQRGAQQESSDFEPGGDEAGEENVSDSESSAKSPRKNTPAVGDESSQSRRPTKRRRGNLGSKQDSGGSEEVEEAEELADELEELQAHGKRSRRPRLPDILMEDRYKTRRQQKKPNYDIMQSNMELAQAIEEEDDGGPAQNTPSRRGRGGGGGGFARSLFSTYGPFGGAGGPPPVLCGPGGPGGVGAAAGADSDSSDDEIMQRPKAPGYGGVHGMTPTTAHPAGFGMFPAVAGQVHGVDPVQGPSGTPANLGKVKDKQALADADPLGVDQNVTFDGVGGLQGHIDQLKEMVALPLLYPEVFQRFAITPPRGVLFHGPPGTGKTLLARALASSVSQQGKKVTFYMRKGADALSKWVGEAERQLRLLFEEARKNQPSIIFFDEIDGLAPVRSSKQEQIHASIVSTLLALMDGMDGRGQVVVIGATNRPDSVDPALRRPGRFDREFYFPLPNLEARRAIIDIHTKGWSPPLKDTFKHEIAYSTKGYGGADLRALCTEAALNAVQRRYPQIYKSNEKLQIDPETINVIAKDFMISIKKMVPSSERSASSGAAPLPKQIEPLLRYALAEVKSIVAEILPQKKSLTALEEAEFEDADDDRGMKAERMQQEFERSRIFRPRLLIKGKPGMGQQYLAGALLNHFEGVHVQAFDLSTLLSDSTRSSEAAIIQLFTEVRRHKPSVIYIPGVDIWYRTVGQAVISTFLGLMRSLPPTDPVLLLGILECEEENVEAQMIKDLFGLSRKNIHDIQGPSRSSRHEYFTTIIEYLNASPDDFPEPTNRKKRHLAILPPAPPDPPKNPLPVTKAESKAQKKKDRMTLNQLKIRIQPIMDQIRPKYRKFRLGVIDQRLISYLLDDEDPAIVSSDLPAEQRRFEDRPYEKSVDDHGEPGLREVATNKFFYNMDITTIEKRLSNGYYKRTKDFLADIKKLSKDAKTLGDEERILRANELQSNVEVDMGVIDAENPWLASELENVYVREKKRELEMIHKAKLAATEQGRELDEMPSNVPPSDAEGSSAEASGQTVLGESLANGVLDHPITPSNPSQPSVNRTGLISGLSDPSDLNGHSQSNGTSGFSGFDLQLSISDERESTGKDTNSSFGPSAQTRPFESHTGPPRDIEHRRSIPGHLSQTSAITPMAPGSQPADYTNYASTTSSDKRQTGSSGDKNTQETMGGPDFSIFPEGIDPNSQIPDTVANTQGSQNSARPGSNNSNPSSSQGQSLSQPERSSQTPAVPAFPRETSKTNINSLLNDEPAPSRAMVTSIAYQSNLMIDEASTSRLLDEMVEQTSGFSVEQLEQIYSALMSEIWRTRGDWDRAKVTRAVEKVFEQVMEDITSTQPVGLGSMEIE